MIGTIITSVLYMWSQNYETKAEQWAWHCPKTISLQAPRQLSKHTSLLFNVYRNWKKFWSDTWKTTFFELISFRDVLSCPVGRFSVFNLLIAAGFSLLSLNAKLG